MELCPSHHRHKVNKTSEPCAKWLQLKSHHALDASRSHKAISFRSALFFLVWLYNRKTRTRCSKVSTHFLVIVTMNDFSWVKINSKKVDKTFLLWLFVSILNGPCNQKPSKKHTKVYFSSNFSTKLFTLKVIRRTKEMTSWEKVARVREG